MFKAVLFDFDGTLADTLGMYIKAYRRVLTHYGFNFADEEIVSKCFGKKEKDICEAAGIPDQAEEFRKMYYAFKHDLLVENKLFPDTLDVLKHFHRNGVKMGVATFASRWYIDKMVDQLDIRRFFEQILSFDDVKNPKPDPEMVTKLCETLGVRPEDSLVVGDSKGDILMGKAAGAKTALFFPKENELFYQLEELKKTEPDFTISNLKELKDLA